MTATLAERAERSKLATVRSAPAAIAAACRAGGRPDPTKTPLVADTLRGIARQHARQPGAARRQARALTCDQAPRSDARRARGWSERRVPLGQPHGGTWFSRTPWPCSYFHAALRRSEVAALRRADVDLSGTDDVVTLRRSKTNPAGARPEVRRLVGGCAVDVRRLHVNRLVFCMFADERQRNCRTTGSRGCCAMRSSCVLRRTERARPIEAEILAQPVPIDLRILKAMR